MVEKLLNGIAIVIDDKINDSKSNDKIIKIIDKIKEKGIPCCTYNNISEAEKYLKNFSSASFLLIDWEMESPTAEHQEEGLQLGGSLKEESEQSVISFIKKFREIAFAPIFSRLDKKTIAYKLVENKIIEENKNGIIYIEKKSKLAKKDNLFDLIDEWIKKNPAVYTLKKWESNFVDSKNSTFNSLFEKSPNWPKILWQTSEKDKTDPKSSINETIYRIIKSKTTLENIDKEIINKRFRKNPDYEEIKDVLIDTMYIDNSKLEINDVSPGDIFYFDNNYYINITPECDTVVGRSRPNKVNLYLLKASPLNEEKFKRENYKKDFGYIEKPNQVLLFGIENKDMFTISLKNITKKKYSEIKDYRICRLLPPNSVYIQQKFSSYISRVGQPRIPELILKGLPKSA